MCGIWASLGTKHIAERFDCVRALEARGPEHTEVCDLSGVSLGFTRLAINGLTVAGNQPFQKGNSYVICNGEIYNYKALASRWGCVLPDGTSDCAIVPELAQKLGMTELCRTMDGVFAFVYVDVDAQTLSVARDPYGVRPLFQAVYDGVRVWSSERKGLPKGSTEIEVFPPGTWKTYSISTGKLVESHQYHTVPYVKMAVFSYPKGRESARYSLAAALTSAVKKRLLSDRPIGALLSGGLDSSVVCAIAAKELAKEGKKLHTFSIGMPGSTDLDYAQKVADYIGSVHTTVLVKPEEFLEAIPSVIRAIESYDITTVRASVGNWLLGKYIQTHTDIKVILNGDGSDEIGGGYLYFYKAPSNEEFEKECVRLLEEIHIYDVLRSDRSMAAHGLEARTPFLDKNVVATWLAMDTEFRRPSVGGVDGSGIAMEKQILREAFDLVSIVPREVLWRKKEAFSDGVSSTADSWYKRCATYAESLNISFSAYTHNAPKTAEGAWYRQIFEEAYGAESANLIPHMWMPQWIEGANDPSARTLSELYV